MDKFKFSKVISLWMLLMIGSFSGWAQAITVSGQVTARDGGEALPGVTVIVKGTTSGTVTDFDGNYKLEVPSQESVLVYSFVGFARQEVTVGSQSTINIQMGEDVQTLSEIVVVGYGKQKKSDLTGSVVSVDAEDFNRGLVGTPEQLIAGKVAGVQITSNGGAPGSGSRIRIRGGSSLNASNDPLVVIDGVPVADGDIAGSANALSLINPDDIASFNILKDASATAIYGSRASNGVILITTKKGESGQGMRVNFNTTHSLSTIPGTMDVLSADQFREVVGQYGSEQQQALLGDFNTDWQDQIFNNAYGTDNNLSVSGSYKGLPYRVSVGYFNQDGILRTGNFQRTSGAVTLNPTFFNNDLKVNVNVRGVMTENIFADEGAIGAAVGFDPTQSPYADNEDFGGYFQWRDANGVFIPTAPRNPLSMLNQRSDQSQVFRSIGNIQLDYSLPFVDGLSANLNLGYDISDSQGDIFIPANFGPLAEQGGETREYSENKRNLLSDFYLNYKTDLEAISSTLDVTAGYSYQEFITDEPTFPTLNVDGVEISPAGIPTYSQNRLKSYFGRVNYSLMDRYLLTATVRADGSSKFSKENRWGVFPSLAFAWKINEEAFMDNVDLISDLKLRLGYGITGQQQVPIDFPHLARYSLSDPTAMYQFGEQYYNLLRAEAYDPSIKWEETITYNAGLDFELAQGKFYGSLDVYHRITDDLLAYIPNAAGTNLTNEFWTNAASMENSGVEAVFNYVAIRNDKMRWEIGINGSYNRNEITRLSKTSDENTVGQLVGGISGGRGNNIQVRTTGYARDMFYVYQQVYDEAGNPIEGLYADRNEDGQITELDKYRYQQPDPLVSLGINSQLSYGNWHMNFVMRGSTGNYIYNNVLSDKGAYRAFQFNGYLANVSTNVLETNFREYRLFSDYYVENAAFLRMDNLTLGYNFGNITERMNLRINANVQNAFTITSYRGLDPEVATGIDNNFYPRPRIFSLSLNLGI